MYDSGRLFVVQPPFTIWLWWRYLFGNVENYFKLAKSFYGFHGYWVVDFNFAHHLASIFQFIWECIFVNFTHICHNYLNMQAETKFSRMNVSCIKSYWQMLFRIECQVYIMWMKSWWNFKSRKKFVLFNSSNQLVINVCFNKPEGKKFLRKNYDVGRYVPSTNRISQSRSKAE